MDDPYDRVSRWQRLSTLRLDVVVSTFSFLSLFGATNRVIGSPVRLGGRVDEGRLHAARVRRGLTGAVQILRGTDEKGGKVHAIGSERCGMRGRKGLAAVLAPR